MYIHILKESSKLMCLDVRMGSPSVETSRMDPNVCAYLGYSSSFKILTTSDNH